MNSWWVNHNVTAQQEIEGDYLWSPKRMKNGRKVSSMTTCERQIPEIELHLSLNLKLVISE